MEEKMEEKDEIYTINGKKYVLSDFILINAPIYTKGCRNGRELLKKKEIDEKYYCFARLEDDDWIVTDGKSIKFDKVFIKKSYLKNIPELNGEKGEFNGFAEAPEIIELDDRDKFVDDEGNILEIETRGEREWNKIYFRAKDISAAFSIKNLINTVRDKNSSHEMEKDYTYFICKKKVKTFFETKKELFFTYTGVIRILFTSRSPIADCFIKWASEKLFTLQMGTEKQKRKLVADVLGVSAETVREVFDRDSKTVPCVYLLTIGYVRDLREKLSLPDKFTDDSIVCKYGFTKDLSRRICEHEKRYGCMGDLKVKLYSYIDPQYMSKAESDISACMKSMDAYIEYKTETELVAIPSKMMMHVETCYKNIAREYMGHISELITRLKEKDAECKTLEKEIELIKINKEYEMEKLNSQIDKLKYEITLTKKESEYQLELYRMKLEMEAHIKKSRK